MSKIGIITAAILSGIVLLCLIRYWISNQIKSFKSRMRIARGVKKEKDAKNVLRKLGYDVVSEQAEYNHSFKVNGKTITVPVRIDYLVRRNGKNYVVEVKSGEKANSMYNKDTRRQVLEYAFVVPSDGIFLLDMESKKLMKVEFLGIHLQNRPSNLNYFWWFVAVFVIGISFLLLKF